VQYRSGKKRQKPSRGERIELHVNGIAEDDRRRSIQSAAPEDVIESLTEGAFGPRQRPWLIHEFSKLDLPRIPARAIEEAVKLPPLGATMDDCCRIGELVLGAPRTL
jgi:hypothetical protein